MVNVLASSLGGGAISALAFAAKLTEPLERAAFSGTRMFMFSRTARLFADRREQEVGRLYAVGLRTSFLLLVPLLWWIALNGDALVQGIFARGQFTPRMTMLVAATLLALVPSVLFVGVASYWRTHSMRWDASRSRAHHAARDARLRRGGHPAFAHPRNAGDRARHHCRLRARLRGFADVLVARGF